MKDREGFFLEMLASRGEGKWFGSSGWLEM